MSTIKVDTVRPVTADASLTLQGDNSGTGVSGITIDSSGNAAFAQNAKVDTIRPNTTDGSLTLQGDSSGSGVTGITIDSSGNATFAQTISGGTIGSSVVFPAGMVLQCVQSQFNPTVESTTNTAYQPSTVFKVIQKKSTSSKILAILSGGYFYVSAFPNGSITTICQTSNTTSFTPTTTYSSGDDPTNNSAFGMEQAYNNNAINTVPHSISWLFDSSGNEYEGFRCFFKSRTSAKTAVFHETNTSYISLTLMEIAQ